MPLKLLAALRSFLRPLFVLLGMSSELQHFDEFPLSSRTGDDVVRWADHLVKMYCLEDTTLGPNYRARRSTLRVTDIRCYKKTKMPEHEYLVVHVDVPHSEGSYIRIERASADLIPKDVNNINADRPNSTLSRGISNRSLQSSQLLINELDAWDSAITVKGWPADILVAQIECRDVSITLLDIALVAQLVHGHSVKYQLFKYQCYWFADTNAGVLETFFNVPESQSSSTRTPADGDSVVQVKDGANGRWKQIRIYERDQATVNEIVELFRDRKEEVEEKVCLLWSDMAF